MSHWGTRSAGAPVLPVNEGGSPPCESGHPALGRGIGPDGRSSMQGSGENGPSATAAAAAPSSPVVLSLQAPADAVLYTSEGHLGVLIVPIPDVNAVSPEEKQHKLPPRLETTALLIHMAAFGILGVIVRYLLQRLSGASNRSLLSNRTPTYMSLPPNMLGSFLMGWLGLVFKGDISHFSDHLATGLVIGFLGSLSTFSGWNQRMLELSTSGHWPYAAAGLFLGLLLVNESFRWGVETAVSFRRCIFGTCEEEQEEGGSTVTTVEHQTSMKWPKRQYAAVITAVMLVIWGLLWGLSGAFARTQLERVDDRALPWLACLVGPPGVWLRWYLARLNDLGLGKKGSLAWLPLGTLIANVLAACTMAALSTLKRAVRNGKCLIVVTGVQYGFLGCLSTVPTFVSEVDAMRQSGHLGRAFAYTAATFLPSFGLGTLIYSLPVWKKNYS